MCVCVMPLFFSRLFIPDVVVVLFLSCRIACIYLYKNERERKKTIIPYSSGVDDSTTAVIQIQFLFVVPCIISWPNWIGKKNARRNNTGKKMNEMHTHKPNKIKSCKMNTIVGNSFALFSYCIHLFYFFFARCCCCYLLVISFDAPHSKSSYS